MIKHFSYLVQGASDPKINLYCAPVDFSETLEAQSFKDTWCHYDILH